MLIVGEPNAEALEESMRKLERKLGREISYTLLSSKELKGRRARKDPFIQDIFRKKHIELLTQ